MGFQITIKGADFSSKGLGNINISEKYIALLGITDSTKKNAIRVFYKDLKDAGLNGKIGYARLFFAGNSLGDSINLMNPVANISANMATYYADNAAYHATTGWSTSKATGHFAKSNFPISGSLNNLHLHAYNSSTSDAESYLLGSQSNTVGVNQFFVGLQRKASGFTRGYIGIYPIETAGWAAAPTGYDTNKTGLLSISRQSNVQKLYDAGVVIATNTRTDTPIVNGTSSLWEGALIDYAASTTTFNGTFRFVAAGFSTWTDADEIALNTALTKFLASIS